ncbi:mannitol dehydrogenase family protein [Roseobacter weihaiensis]|uniref:mannitol dehydrogenase family protein n=1 Tax=Roseobacter weihaiensis TaxID=2763262 RepID=UPI001D09ACC1|nr:mannitol dehydrogenase family protein [Roseobacter sp. H9]
MTDLPRLTRKGPAPAPGLVHLGPGAFFRAFNAVYTDDVMAAEGGPWGIIAVSLQSARAAEALGPQGGVYTSVTLGPDATDVRVIEAISRVITAPEDPVAVVQAMADPQIRIVSLTVTEKGYCHHPSTGALRRDAPEIRHDLAHPDHPKTAPGFIVAALAKRRAEGLRPFTVLSCDNLPDNGAMLRRIILEFARLRDPALAGWIEREGRFPATMVDRITPATTPQDVDRLAAQTGYVDLACVQHEAFRQWVIEDDFVDGVRPAWDRAGAQFVTSVAAHEMMKLRCLNGTHSALAYLGYLAGHETISETVAEQCFATLCEKLWSEEIIPTVPQPEGEDLPAYVQALLARYRNPAIRHRTWQIAMDGSQKLPQRILGTIMDRRDAGQGAPGLCLVVAAWMRYVGGTDEEGARIDVRDPLAERLKAASDAASDPAEKVAALLAFAEVFPTELTDDARFFSAVTAAYADLVKNGARASVKAYTGSG